MWNDRFRIDVAPPRLPLTPLFTAMLRGALAAAFTGCAINSGVTLGGSLQVVV